MARSPDPFYNIKLFFSRLFWVPNGRFVSHFLLAGVMPRAIRISGKCLDAVEVVARSTMTMSRFDWGKMKIALCFREVLSRAGLLLSVMLP